MKLLSTHLVFCFSIFFIFSLAGCGEDSVKKIQGTWESDPVMPANKEALLYHQNRPTKTKLTISDKFIYFFDSRPMTYTSNKEGDEIQLHINKDSFLESNPEVKTLRGLDSILPKVTNLSCTLLESDIMDCTFAEWWAGSTLKNKFKKHTYNNKQYDHRTIRFKRLTTAN